MKFQAKFVTSVAKFDDCPKDGRPEVAFLGRSNVGKSSLINALVDRRGLAKTSSTPGKTQLLNYFLLDESFYLVDMPGYGYAKEGKEKRLEWAKLSQRYLTEQEALRVVFLLIDSRHKGLKSDVAAIDWLSERNIPVAIVLTKIDKITQQDLKAHERFLLGQAEQIAAIISTSSKTGKGMQLLKTFLGQLLETGQRPK